MRCPHCGENIDESIFPPPLTYCPYCGQNLEASGTEGATEAMHFCPHCGKELPGRVSFCPYCGGEIAARRTTTHYERLEGVEPAERRAKPIIEPPPEQKKKAGKLYKEWMKYANLPPEAAPSTETPREMPAGREKNLQRLPVMYIVIGLCIIALFVLITIVLVQSC